MGKTRWTEESLLRMKGECEDYIILLNQALAIRSTPEMETLLDNWMSAQSAINTILDLYHSESARDMDGLIHCVLWFMVSHAAGLDDVKAVVNHAAGIPGATAPRRNVRRRRRP